MSGKELIKVLERHGWVQVRHKGSHVRMMKAGFAPLSVPVHGSHDLKQGTLHPLLKHAGLTKGDL
jgi:predicted RNA binding protein YcfA (HicA-like mRNA interferase family)